jgi:hypothetical protein
METKGSESPKDIAEHVLITASNVIFFVKIAAGIMVDLRLVYSTAIIALS